MVCLPRLRDVCSLNGVSTVDAGWTVAALLRVATPEWVENARNRCKYQFALPVLSKDCYKLGLRLIDEGQVKGNLPPNNQTHQF